MMKQMCYAFLGLMVVGAGGALCARDDASSFKSVGELTSDFEQSALKSWFVLTFAKDNLVMSGINVKEQEGWLRAVNEIDKRSALLPQFVEHSKKSFAIVNDLHAKVAPFLNKQKEFELRNQDTSQLKAVLASTKNSVNAQLKALSILKAANVLDKVTIDILIDVFSKIQKDIDRLIALCTKKGSGISTEPFRYITNGSYETNQTKYKVEFETLLKRFNFFTDGKPKQLHKTYTDLVALVKTLNQKYSVWLKTSEIIVPASGSQEREKEKKALGGYKNDINKQIEKLKGLEKELPGDAQFQQLRREVLNMYLQLGQEVDRLVIAVRAA
jgi:hypothetical protein